VYQKHSWKSGGKMGAPRTFKVAAALLDPANSGDPVILGVWENVPAHSKALPAIVGLPLALRRFEQAETVKVTTNYAIEGAIIAFTMACEPTSPEVTKRLRTFLKTYFEDKND